MAFLEHKIKTRRNNRCSECLQDARLKVLFAFILAVFIGAGVPFFINTYFKQVQSETEVSLQCCLEKELRIDCLSGVPLSFQTKGQCEKAGCCWEEYGDPIPNCFHSYPTMYSYEYQRQENSEDSNITLSLKSKFSSTPLNVTPSENIAFKLEYWSPNHLRVLIQEKNNFNPLDYLPYLENKPNFEFKELNYNVTFSKSESFYFKIYRKEDFQNVPIFNTYFGPMIISDSFTEITTLLPSFDIYGIGQTPKNSFRHNLKRPQKYVLFNRVDLRNESSPQFQTAGSHPFYLVMEKGGKAHGVLLLSSLPLEIVTNGAPSVTFRTVESKLDFHIFLGPTPKEVIRQLTDFTGKPALPPYWALGYHSCREAENLETSLNFLAFLKSRKIPHESDCGYSQISSAELSIKRDLNYKKFISNLNHQNKKFVTFEKPHIPIELCANTSTSQKTVYKILVKNPVTNKPFVGRLPCGDKVVFPDFFQEQNATNWFISYFSMRKLPVNGVFLDLNSPLNYDSIAENSMTCDPKNNIMEYMNFNDFINDGTICLDAQHVSKQQHLLFHNMYGYKHTEVMKSVLQQQNKNSRLFLASLSTFVGSGKHGGHWGGLMGSSWKALKQTVIQMLDFNLFGVPLYGSPICGSAGDINVNLCSRWIQMAAFQPFMMTHRTDDDEIFYNDTHLVTVGRIMSQLHYSLLPYFYSLFFNATQNGDTVVRPLFFEFPTDRDTYGIDSQFMWGAGLLVSPVMEPSVRKINSYFPAGCWYNYFNGKKEHDSNTGAFKELIVLEYHGNLHIRGGHIIPSQEPGLTTYESTRKNFTIAIAVSCFATESNKLEAVDSREILSCGEIFIDDGKTPLNSEDKAFLLVSIVLKGREIIFNPQLHNLNSKLPKSISTKLNAIHIYGIPEKPSKFFVNDIEVNFTYKSVIESVILNNLNLNLRFNQTLQWIPAT